MTKIYKTWSEFNARENRLENGVSEQFAIDFPDYEKKNLTNEGCWNCSDCSDCSGCSRCSGCSGCSDCSGCSRCSRCSGCSDLKNARPVAGKESNGIVIPTIENIHQKVLEAIGDGKQFDMEGWHKETSCGTTHCRGGWVITLAGEAGKKLEEQTSSEFAAMAIYHKSSPIRVSPVRFYEDNEKALADIKKCALEESKLTPAQ